MDTDVMTVEELGAYLRVDPQTVYRQFREGLIPGVKIGRAIRFKREIIDAWFRLAACRPDPAARRELLDWARDFAASHRITEAKVNEAVRRRRKGGH